MQYNLHKKSIFFTTYDGKKNQLSRYGLGRIKKKFINKKKGKLK